MRKIPPSARLRYASSSRGNGGPVVSLQPAARIAAAVITEDRWRRRRITSSLMSRRAGRKRIAPGYRLTPVAPLSCGAATWRGGRVAEGGGLPAGWAVEHRDQRGRARAAEQVPRHAAHAEPRAEREAERRHEAERETLLCQPRRHGVH